MTSNRLLLISNKVQANRRPQLAAVGEGKEFRECPAAAVDQVALAEAVAHAAEAASLRSAGP